VVEPVAGAVPPQNIDAGGHGKSRRGWIVTEGNRSTMLIGALIWASVK